ncbi:NTP transferase domain-containing protein [Thalassotalea aquiviva]|uniref:nucleotidyltransferase family protein n=1 Tax=Thalassotalea aquiviva TaxID=3242415 RepID=UPI00352AC740
MHIALVLAAGISSRYGSDKRLSSPEHLTKPLLLQTLESVKPHYDMLFVIQNAQDQHIAKLLGNQDVFVLTAPSSPIGLGHSIAAGVQQIQKLLPATSVQTLTLLLADMPFIQPSTMVKLKQFAKPNRIIRPSYQGQPGHPVCFGVDYIDDLSNLTYPLGAKPIIEQHKQNLVEIKVNDVGVIKDIDTPADWLTSQQ